MNGGGAWLIVGARLAAAHLTTVPGVNPMLNRIGLILME
jgi:hypothetical protein